MITIIPQLAQHIGYIPGIAGELNFLKCVFFANCGILAFFIIALSPAFIIVMVYNAIRYWGRRFFRHFYFRKKWARDFWHTFIEPDLG